MVKYTPTVISLFAGCGGSSLGYHLAGYKELLAVDFDDNAVKTFELNFKDVPIWKADITQLSGEKILDFCEIQKGDLDVLDGSPPCQGFSTAGKRCVMDDRNDLVNHYIRLVDEIRPKVFVMENVSGMVKGKMKGLFIGYIRAMKDLGYCVECRMLNAKWFSVPQSRQRIICIGVRNDLKTNPVFPKAHEWVITVREAIKGVVNKTFIPTSEYVSREMLRVPQGKSAASIRKDRMHFGNERLHYDRPSSTLRKSMRPGMNACYHPIEQRNMTIEEIKRLQSFPDDFKFVGKPVEQWARIGNSVPPLMAKAIAETIRDEILQQL